MDFTIELKDLVSMLVSIVCGGCIGFEREYKNKSTGFRTIMLITLGSTIFSIVSRHGAGADDRISANIITGIGFIGAGVIFKDKLTVMGLTTAAVIWTSAAIGMTTGIGYHSLAIAFTAITLLILLSVDKIEVLIDNLQKSKVVNVNFNSANMEHLTQLEDKIKEQKLKSKRLQLYKEGEQLCAVLQISGERRKFDLLSQQMVGMKEIESFH
nr:MgtC/SapB family protein [uncultured Mucilaginibacter sp.]